MGYSPSPLWLHPCPEPEKGIRAAFSEARNALSSRKDAYVFFRADDIAVPGRQFMRLTELFDRYRVPLCLAVVPVWLTAERWEFLEKLNRRSPERWCWHQHGWRHVNHEKTGKKQEFGPGRAAALIEADLTRGRQRLEMLMSDAFYPVFTPPWNRCDLNTLQFLERDGYAAVSRSRGSQPPAPEYLPDFQVNVDLHTRKDVDSVSDWAAFFAELTKGLASGQCGIMIHHQRMNDAAFFFLELFLKELVQFRNFHPVHFKDLAGTVNRPSSL